MTWLLGYFSITAYVKDSLNMVRQLYILHFLEGMTGIQCPKIVKFT